MQLTLLGDDGTAVESRIVDASAGGVRIESSLLLRVGSLVKIEWSDTLILGEVLYSQPAPGEGVSVFGIELTQALYGMADLRRLNSSLNGSDRERVHSPALDTVTT